MTPEEREVILKATTWVRWFRNTIAQKEKYAGGSATDLVEAVDKMHRMADSRFGGFDWCVDQVVQPPSAPGAFKVRGPNEAWSSFQFKRLGRYSNQETAQLVADALNALFTSRATSP